MSLSRKFYSKSVNICGALSLLVFTQVSADTVGIIGGIDLTGGPPYGAVVSSSGSLTPLSLGDPLTISGGIIQSVSMNSSGVSLIGGQQLDSLSGFSPAYAAFVSSSGGVTPLDITGLPAMHGIIYGVAINNSGNGLIGGRDTTGPIYAALVSTSGNTLTPLTFPPVVAAGGVILTVAMSDSGTGLVGGRAFFGGQPGYAALITPSGSVNSLTLTGGIDTTGQISSVAINSSGNGLIGGQDLTGSLPAYAAQVSSSGSLTPIALTGGVATTGIINTVAINAAGNGLIGGQDLTGSAPAYAAQISSSGQATALTFTGGMATNGIINTVAINRSGNGIIGGQDFTGSQPAYAALVSSSGIVTPLALGTNLDTNGTIYSAAINDSGNGLIGGWDLTGSQPGYAALFTSSGTVVPLTLAGGIATNGWINSVAIPLMAGIPTASLSGNNLIFANYINRFAPDDALYFIPAILDGTLNAALESSAPTRNGVSIYTASNNLFFLSNSFANHIRNEQTEKLGQPTKAIADLEESRLPEDELLTSLSLRKKTQKKEPPKPQNKLLSIWFDAIGAWAHQKPQHQTVGFDPVTGGLILAFDGRITPQVRVGGGVSYLFTHIHERKNQGHRTINQEDAFLYSSWDNQKFYVDLLVLGGALQIDQVRKTRMTGFSFHSRSKPHGWQLLPHLELGFKANLFKHSPSANYYLNLFGMVDWANAWQERYQEKGDSPFNAAQKSYYGSLLRTEAGLRFYEIFYFDSWNLTLQEKVSYVNAQSFNAGRVNALLVGSPGSFTVETLSSAQNLGVAQLAVSFDPLKASYPKTTLSYQGEFSRPYQSHQCNLELTWQF